MTRRYYQFSGWVQGVGFRYRACHAARLHGCTGWVRNEPDGSVTMEIQGEGTAIEAVIDAIEHGTWVRIEDMRWRELPLIPEETGFIPSD